MKKLNKLLDEYKNVKWDLHYSVSTNWAILYDDSIIWHSWEVYFVTTAELISKSYGFIEWLVENNKIDLRAISEKELETWWSLENKILDEENTKESWIKFWTENLLMLLAIQDNPIEFLISILR